MRMRNILKNRWALSTVVTTLIILVVSVLLAGVVTYFAINVTSTRVQEESLSLTKLHVWCPSNSSDPQAAFLIINTGGRDVVIQKITVRGQAADWTNIYYNTTGSSVTNDFTYISALTGTPTVKISTSTTIGISAASGELTLDSGKSMIVVIDNPDSITINDIGLTVGITVFTSQAMYYQEANVQAV